MKPPIYSLSNRRRRGNESLTKTGGKFGMGRILSLPPKSRRVLTERGSVTRSALPANQGWNSFRVTLPVLRCGSQSRAPGQCADTSVGIRIASGSSLRRGGDSLSPRCFLLLLALLTLGSLTRLSAQTILFTGGVIHTAIHGTITNGVVLVESNKIIGVYDPAKGEALPPSLPTTTTVINLNGQQLYPGLIAMDSGLGLVEIGAVRATDDTVEVGDFTPDLESWVAVNPDSELLPVARANGIAYFEAVPQGKILAGQSAVMSMDGWTWEQMLVKKPAAMHLVWPDLSLDTTPKERLADPSTAKSLADQDKERRKSLAAIQDFFDDARAYAKARSAARPTDLVPAWEAMLPVLRGEIPLAIHADDLRQIKSAVKWAVTNHLHMVLYGGMDAWKVADLLATNHIPVVFERVFNQPSRDYEPMDVHFTAPEVLRRAGVTVMFGTTSSSFGAAMARNLPYQAAQAIAFGYPEEDALKGMTLYPAQMLGVASRLGSIAAGHDATLFICDGSLFDIRANVKRMWIAGREISLASRHTRLYEKYKNRPQ